MAETSGGAESVANPPRSDSPTRRSTSKLSDLALQDQPAAVAPQGKAVADAEEEDEVAAAGRLQDKVAAAAKAAADQEGKAAAAADQLEAAADQLKAAADRLERNVAAAGRLQDKVAAAAKAAAEQEGKAADTSVQLKAAADRLEGKVTAADAVVQFKTAADQLRVAADRLEAAAVHPAAGTPAVQADLEADLREGLCLIEKALQDTRDTLRRLAAPSGCPSGSGIVDQVEITNLVVIGRYPKLAKALELWYQRDKDLKAKIAQKEARRSDLRNQIYNIIGWYAVYLGVVLTAVSQLTKISSDSAPLCKKVWFPIVLTVLGVAATTAGLIVKFKDLSLLDYNINSDQKTSVELNRRIALLGREGLKFDFRTGIGAGKPLSVSSKFYNFRGKTFVIVALVIFAGFFILSYFVILCDTWT